MHEIFKTTQHNKAMNLIDIYTENNIYDFEYLDSFEKGFGLALGCLSSSLESDFYLLSKLHKSYNIESVLSLSNSFKDTLAYYESLIKRIININKTELEDKINKHLIFELENNRICLVVIDLYDLYYSPYYKKEHHPYLLIVNGFNKNTQLLSIVDTQQTIIRGKSAGLIYEPFLMPYSMIDDMSLSVYNRYGHKYFYSLSSEITDNARNKNLVLYHILDIYLHKIRDSFCNEKHLIEFLNNQTENSQNDIINNKYINEFEFNFKSLLNNKFVFYKEISKNILANNCDKYEIDHYVNDLLNELAKIKKAVIISTKKQKKNNLENKFKSASFIEDKIKNTLKSFNCKLTNSKNDLCCKKNAITNNNNNTTVNILKENDSLDSSLSRTEAVLRNIIEKIANIHDFHISSTLNYLGINSIGAIKIMNEIHKEFNIEVPLMLFLNNCKLSDIIHFLENSQNDKQTLSPLTKSEKRKYYPLGRYQNDLIMYTSKLYGDGLAYNITIVLDKKEKFNKKRLEMAFSHIINKHEAFRMNFYSTQDDDYLIVHDKIDFNLEYVNINYNERGHFFSRWIKPFNLEKSILIRACLIEYTDRPSSSLIVDIHHIISDGGSINIFFRELASFYNEENIDKTNLIDFTDYIIWENDIKQAPFYAKQQKFWEDYYSDGIPKLNLPIDNSFIDSQNIGFESVLVDYMYNENFNKLLSDFNRKYSYTHYMILLSVINILLYKYTGQEDLVIWTPTANRQIAEQTNMIGMFVNTVPIRNRIDPNIMFLDFLKLVKNNCVEVFSNTSLDINKLKKKLMIDDKENLYQMVFIYQNYESNLLKFDNEIITPFRINQNIIRFNLLIEAYENDDKTKVVVKYKPQLFKRETIDKLIFQIESLTLKLLDNPHAKISDISI